MNARNTIKLLAAVCLAEAVAIGFWLWPKLVGQVAQPRVELTADGSPQARSEQAPTVATAVEATVSPAELAKQNVALATELAEVKEELDKRKSEISFSYGSVRDSGRFVGMTFRKMFETAAAHGLQEAEERMADNHLNILSLGPFIQDAEVMESDPGAFAQFQAPLISEVLGLPREREAEVEAVLEDLKAQSLKVEEGSAQWAALNDAALTKVTALLSDDQKLALQPQIKFLQQYGVLMIPAYSILRAPAPTVVSPEKKE